MKQSYLRTVARVILPFFILNPIASFLMRGKTAAAPKHDVEFELFGYEEAMEIHSKAQANFLKAATGEGTSRYQGKSELSRPTPAEFAWNITFDGEESDFDEYTVYLGDTKSLRNADKYVTEEDTIKIYNMELGETYYWCVSVEVDGYEYKSETQSFTVADAAPRNLYIDGVTNARDIGGWKCDDGRVKQCMIYRTGQIHDDGGAIITEKGMKTMLDELGIKTEIDLRNDITPTEFGVLGEEVNYVILPMSFSDDMMFNDSQAEEICAFFKILADKNNYPLFFHCVIGTDRTGLCAFLLNGLLGVAEEDLYRDYRFSNFGFIGGERDGHNITHCIELLDRFDGDTLSERIENYLISIGVTSAEIESVRNIMIEK